MSDQPIARHDPENSRYVVEMEGRIVGFTEYHLRGGNRYFFYHTEIDEDQAGKGIGSSLARFALDDVRAKEGIVIPLCPFIAAWIERHPDYEDLVDRVIMDRVTGSTG